MDGKNITNYISDSPIPIVILPGIPNTENLVHDVYFDKWLDWKTAYLSMPVILFYLC
jgi:hypothetical protein